MRPRWVWTWLALALALPLQAAEEIRRFHADIEIAADASMIVTETISVAAEGRRIRRGIYRDLPLTYRDRGGHRYRVRFDLLDVKRNGSPEPFQQEAFGNGVRIRIGDADRLLPPGTHSYRIRYRTGRQLGFFDEHDELYWNVTGTGWGFPIRRASARIELPASVAASEVRQDAWTGAEGSRERGASWSFDSGTTAHFETDRALAPYEGLTVALAFPKGIVRAPGLEQRTRWFFQDNGYLLVGILGLVVVLAYYLYWWRRVGRDPRRGVIIPIYEPPEGLSPAAVRYLFKRRYDHTAFVAAVVNLAVKQALEMVEKRKSWWVFRKNPEAPMSPGEEKIFRELLGERAGLEFDQDNHRVIAAAIDAHRGQVRGEIEGLYLRRHRRRWLPGIVLSTLAIAAMFLVGPGATPATLAPTVLAFLVLPLVMSTVVLAALRRGDGKGLHGLLLLALVVLVGTGFLLSLVDERAAGGTGGFGFGVLLVIAGHLLAAAAFFFWMEAPTEAGRDLLDRIEGLKLYIDVAEKDELVRRQEPPQTLDRFEQILPYAIALGVADTWADHFQSVLARAMASGELPARSWATGAVARGDFSGRAVAAGLATGLGTAIAASSVPPGTSSGFSGGGGGGGFSGGGGGGGGGGGW